MDQVWLRQLPALDKLRFSRLANLFLVPVTTSTNDLAKSFIEKMLAEDSDLLPTAFVTRRQTAGRGRAGRAWTTLEATGLAVSLVVPWPEAQARIRLPLTAGIALARGLSSRFGLDVRLKWPNDLLVHGQKLGGILVEARSGDEGVGYAVIGVGINLTSTREELDQAGLSRATSLSLESKGGPGLEDPVLSVLEVLDELVGFTVESIPDAFAEVTAHAPGDPLVVRSGDRVVEGAYVGVTEDGLLKLSTAGGEVTVVSGDVDPRDPS